MKMKFTCINCLENIFVPCQQKLCIYRHVFSLIPKSLGKACYFISHNQETKALRS